MMSDENRTYTLALMSFHPESVFFNVYLGYYLAQKMEVTFHHQVNSSTINEVSDKKIDFDFSFDFAFEDSGHWLNATYNGNMNFTYGNTTNVLLQSVITSEATVIQWNGTSTEYDTFPMRERYTMDIVAPESLLNDFPTLPSEPDPEPDPEPIIPGYSVTFLLAFMLAGITFVILIKKRKRNRFN
jgi:hypothetical protein